jgi:DHA1 family multidrug resistance protein-like MFS transporter
VPPAAAGRSDAPGRSDAAAAPPAPSARRGVRVAVALLFLSFLDVFALLPTVAPRAVELGAGAAALGLVVGAYSAANLPANLLGGWLVDRVGRRLVLVVGLLGAGGAVAAYALAGSVEQLVAVRLLHGAAGGVLVPAVFAVMADHARAAGGAGRAMGRAGAVIGAAAVVGPAAAGVVRQLGGTSAVFLGVGGLLVVGAALAVAALPADRGRAGAASAAGEVADPAGVLAPSRRRLPGEVRGALGGLVATTAAVGVLAGYLPGVVEARGAPPATTGLLFTVYALVAAGLMLSPLAGRVDRDGPRRPVAIGLGALAGALALLAVVPADARAGLAVVLVAVALFGCGYGLVFPAVSGAVAIASPKARRGRAVGWFNVAFSVGLAVGPPVAGAVAETLPAVDPFAVVAAGCLVATVALGRGRTVRSGPRPHGPRRARPRRASRARSGRR